MGFFARYPLSRKQKPAQPIRRRPARSRPHLECLEDRWLLSQLFTVNSATDDPLGPTAGTVTLRDAINDVNNDHTDSLSNPDTIKFAINGTPTITLAANLPAIANPVIIDGTTQAGVTIDGQAAAGANSNQGFGVLVVNSAATEKNVTFTDGTLTVNVGGTLSAVGNFTLGDANGDSTTVQNYGNLSVSGNVVGANNIGVNNNSGATLQVAGAFTAGQDGYLYDFGTAALNVTGNFTLGDFGFVENGLGGTNQSNCTVGGSFNIGVDGFVQNFGTSALSVGESFNIGVNGFVQNFGTSALSVGGNLTLAQRLRGQRYVLH